MLTDESRTGTQQLPHTACGRTAVHDGQAADAGAAERAVGGVQVVVGVHGDDRGGSRPVGMLTVDDLLRDVVQRLLDLLVPVSRSALREPAT